MARVEPRTYSFEQLVEQVRNGRLRVPRFQREFVWKYKQVRMLFRSIALGYPVGTLLIWSTSERYSSFGEIGPIQLDTEQPPKPTEVGYVLDGHQRVSVMVGALSLSDDEAGSLEGQKRAFLVYYDLDREKFSHERTPKDQHLPLRYLLSSEADPLTTWIDERRDRTQQGSTERERWDRNRRRAFALQTTFAQYRVPYLEVTNADLPEAVNIFTLLNTQGTPAKPHEVFAALTWRQDSFDFAGEAKRLLADYPNHDNFGTDPVLRALLASLGESVYEDNWQAVQDRHGDQLQQRFSEISVAFGRAVDFLVENVGVRSGRVLPYALQLVALTEFFRRTPKAEPAQASELVRWIWASGFSQAYSAATASGADELLRRIGSLAAGEETQLLNEPALMEPYPVTFHPKAARVRVFHLFLASKGPRDLTTGEVLSNILEAGMADGYSIAGKGRSTGWPLAGRILIGTNNRRRAEDQFRALENKSERETVLRSHLIPNEAYAAWLVGDEDTFMELRRDALVREERDFARGFLQVPEEGALLQYEPIIDVEDEEMFEP